ncbi:hypothetical protein KAR91_56680 [Candidatus Pacearchaeota archaeon]|nr:hypothetical protein [Candidatus Pacearchaeota archaeon]
MSSFICEHCGTEIIDTNSGYITSCPHYDKDDIIELSGKQMDNGLPIKEADMKAIELLREASK